jgi:hypothetical protein|tara:strand:+ start:2173 stop:2655 length:483 start_codon:yes stop_codon:yes gene_type:complete
MSLEETELKIGNTSFKGVYIAILFSLATTLGGGVWTASSLYGRLEAQEGRRIPDITAIEEKITLIKQELTANDVSQLQGKLATLGTNLVTIMEQQEKLLLIDENVDKLELEVKSMKATVTQAELIAKSMSGVDSEMKVIKREITDLWNGLDYITDSNPLK